MAKNKKNKRDKNIILVLVEGKSEIMALEGPLSAMFDEISPKYRVMFALQRRQINNNGTEKDDQQYDETEDYFDEIDEEETEYDWGGDITSSNYVKPKNIETKITNRFFKPLIEKEKIYSKMLLEVIHIVDLDGSFIDEDRVVSLSQGRSGDDSPYYDDINGVIECTNVEDIRDRNIRKRRNLEYLCSLETIKIETKSVPYSVYYFSSNLDHFLHNDANMGVNKINKARDFSMKYVFDTEGFYKYFINDKDSAKELSYKESWEVIKEGKNSLMRKTNFDLLMKRIKARDFPEL